MTRSVVIVGAGGHGREVLDAIRMLNSSNSDAGGADGDVEQMEVVGFVADAWPNIAELEDLGVARLGGMDVLRGRDVAVIVAVGDGRARRVIDADCTALGIEAITVVHPRTTVGSGAVIADGCYLGPGVSVMTNVRLGRHVHINVNAVVSHDAVVGAFTTLSPGVMINGAARVGEEVFFGTGAIVLPGRVVGDGAVIGAGAVVIDDVPAGVTMVGVPARQVGG